MEQRLTHCTDSGTATSLVHECERPFSFSSRHSGPDRGARFSPQARRSLSQAGPRIKSGVTDAFGFSRGDLGLLPPNGGHYRCVQNIGYVAPARKRCRSEHEPIASIRDQCIPPSMDTEALLLNAIASDFLQPTADRLADQLHRRIELVVSLKLDAKSCERTVVAGTLERPSLCGAVRIRASDTAIPDRYKYDLQCILPDDGLDGFSGMRLKGAVRLTPIHAINEYPGFTYNYNCWEWSAKLRDF